MQSSLLGISDPIKFVDPMRMEWRERGGRIGAERKGDTVNYTIAVIFITAFIFITLVSLYDLMRAIMFNQENHKEETEILLRVSVKFTSFCVLISLVSVPALIYYIRMHPES